MKSFFCFDVQLTRIRILQNYPYVCIVPGKCFWLVVCLSYFLVGVITTPEPCHGPAFQAIQVSRILWMQHTIDAAQAAYDISQCLIDSLIA